MKMVLRIISAANCSEVWYYSFVMEIQFQVVETIYSRFGRHAASIELNVHWSLKMKFPKLGRGRGSHSETSPTQDGKGRFRGSVDGWRESRGADGLMPSASSRGLDAPRGTAKRPAQGGNAARRARRLSPEPAWQPPPKPVVPGGVVRRPPLMVDWSLVSYGDRRAYISFLSVFPSLLRSFTSSMQGQCRACTILFTPPAGQQHGHDPDLQRHRLSPTRHTCPPSPRLVPGMSRRAGGSGRQRWVERRHRTWHGHGSRRRWVQPCRDQRSTGDALYVRVLGLSATTSQQYSSLRTNQHRPSATSQPNSLVVAGDTGTQLSLMTWQAPDLADGRTNELTGQDHARTPAATHATHSAGILTRRCVCLQKAHGGVTSRSAALWLRDRHHLLAKSGNAFLASTGSVLRLSCPPLCLAKQQQYRWIIKTQAVCSFGWCLMPGADLFWEKSTIGWCLVLICSERKVLLAGYWLITSCWFVLREKYCWLMADKPNELGEDWRYFLNNSRPGRPSDQARYFPTSKGSERSQMCGWLQLKTKPD
jgi:hypothetical protein